MGGGISSSEGLDRLKKWSDQKAELRVLYFDLGKNAPSETDGRIVVTASNELEISAPPMKHNLEGAEFSEATTDTLQVKLRDGQRLAFREPRQPKGE